MLFAMILSLIILISSCNKDSNNTVNSASIAIVQGSPDVPAADLYLNGTLSSGTPLVYGSYIQYLHIASGVVKVGLDYTGTTTPIINDTVNLASGKSYSLFLSDLKAKHDYLLIADTVAAPASGKASIRLVNMSPDAPGVDLVIGGKVIAANKSYKQVSSFTAIPASDNDTLKVMQTGTSNLLGVVNAVTVNSGVVYTVWLNGFASGVNGYSLHANIMRNAVY